MQVVALVRQKPYDYSILRAQAGGRRDFWGKHADLDNLLVLHVKQRNRENEFSVDPQHETAGPAGHEVVRQRGTLLNGTVPTRVETVDIHGTVQEGQADSPGNSKMRNCSGFVFDKRLRIALQDGYFVVGNLKH